MAAGFVHGWHHRGARDRDALEVIKIRLQQQRGLSKDQMKYKASNPDGRLQYRLQQRRGLSKDQMKYKQIHLLCL